ncbi:GNAT family N-acetyltransferase [Edaphovirga cremea]|uniref:GNAT family N-acetyltransferase n=1 Tax=Edaphovirga cremea TaxID=2267246 RepID=UPI003988E101
MKPTTPLFSRDDAAGVFTLRRLQLPDDAIFLHQWMTQSYARFWGMLDSTREEVESTYRKLLADDPLAALIGECNGSPAFLMEFYHAQHDAIGEYYQALPGDYGMHLLIAPATVPVAGFSWQVFSTVMDYMFSLPQVTRVVVEPDVRNEKIHRLNKRAGFIYLHTVDLPHKTAWLAFCQREDYQRERPLSLENAPMRSVIEIKPVNELKSNVGIKPNNEMQTGHHLQLELWSKANALLLRKALAEFAHERLIDPIAEYSSQNWTHYRLPVPESEVEYRFRAQNLPLNDWLIDLSSLCKLNNGHHEPLDALQFIIEFTQQVGIPAHLLPTYMEEITSTLYGSAFKLAKNAPNAQQLTEADFQTVETTMSEGHPCFVANNGRIGFDAADYQRYAPEAASPVKLVWVAVHDSKATFASIAGLGYQQLMREEIGQTQIDHFTQKLQQIGVDPQRYFFMPVHPWQWQNKLLTVFAPDIAAQHLVYLGEGEDDYLAQQSIRTFFNISQPQHRYVKTALSILNMGFMRGLSPYYMATTPGINEWLAELVEQDPYLQQCGFSILREVASLGYRNSYFERAIVGDSAYKKMFAALWRDNPTVNLKANQRLMTMASLLHIDNEGQALLPAMITSSGLSTEAWLKAYLRCYLSPLIHSFYHYDLVFMPHGENLILQFENNVPVKAYMKDIAEEIAVLNPDANLPEKARRIAVDVPEHLKVLSIFTDVFACFFRFMGRILTEHSDFPQARFWQLVAENISEYIQKHPELTSKFERYDLFTAEFSHSCLNRLQLANNQQMINLSDPAQNLKFAGTLVNPIAQWKPKK